MRFKVGDKVRVNDLVEKSGRKKYIGKIVTITEAEIGIESTEYSIMEDDGCFWWTDEMFDPIETDKPELVNHPDHYQGNKFEVIDIIEDYDLNFHLGSVIKYVLRAGKKDSKSTDLEKAIWYLERELENENKN